MNLIDFVMIVVFAFSVFSGYHSGIVRSLVSIIGLIAGIEFASRNYFRFAKELAPMVHSLPLSQAIWFVLQVIIVMIAFGMVGNIIQNEIQWMELTKIDKVAGVVLGAIRGVGLTAVCIFVMAAFYSTSDELSTALLPKYILGPAEVLSNLTTDALRQRILTGLQALEPQVPNTSGNPDNAS